MASALVDQVRRIPDPVMPVKRSEIISALSFALDLTEGQSLGHSIRSCILGMHLAEEIGVPQAERGDLFYALLLKDAGCSTNASKMAQLTGSDDIAAKRDVKITDWTRFRWETLQYALSHVRPGASFAVRMLAICEIGLHQHRTKHEMVSMRCERGASIARRIGLSETVAQAIFSLDEMWNGSGHPRGLRGSQIPLFSRIMNLAQTLHVFYVERGPAAALEIAEKRSGRWFDPELVSAFRSIARRGDIWDDLTASRNRVLDFAPHNTEADLVNADESLIDNICQAFADVIDAKSPFTYRHSTGVAQAAVAIGRTLGMNDPDVKLLLRAGLLHDIGKLSVPNTILDKPGALTSTEWKTVRDHPFYSLEILNRVPGFGQIAEVAASHHEKLDGTGYFRSLDASRLSMPSRVLAVADIYDALVSNRPYREGLPFEKVMKIVQKEAPHALDGDCVDALRQSAPKLAA